MNDEPAGDFSTLRITAEENILYLLEELDRALERTTPVWTQYQAKVANRLVIRLTDKLGAIAAKLRAGRGRRSNDGRAVLLIFAAIAV